MSGRTLDLFARTAMTPVMSVMTQGMLLGIKQRAERARRVEAAGEAA